MTSLNDGLIINDAILPDMRFDAIGIRGPTEFGAIVKHFTGMGGDVVLLDPDAVLRRGRSPKARTGPRRSPPR